MHVFFINFKKAYNSIHKISLINSLKEFNLPQILIRVIEINITEIFVKIKVGTAETESILIKTGLRQGDSISPILFNLILEKVVREMNIHAQGSFEFQELAIAVLAYTNDVVLVSKLHNNLRSLFIRLEEKAKKVGLQLNEEKQNIWLWVEEIVWRFSIPEGW